MKKHKEEYRLERIIRIQLAFHKIPDFWGLFKMVLARPPMPTTENTIRLDGSSINQLINLRLYETQCPPTSDSSMKRDAIWGSYHVSFIAPPLRLPCSMALKPYLSPLLQSLSESNHQHTHLYISGNLLNLTLELGQPDETGAPRLPDRPEKGFGQMVPEEFFNKFMKNEVFYFIKI